MSYLERLQAKAAKASVSEPVKGSEAPSAPFAGEATGRFRGLPADLVAGLKSLRTDSGPIITRPEVWPEVVADAIRLAGEGWAVKALALGWQPIQLWGSPMPGGSVDDEGLAVRLCGRRIVLLDEASAIMESAAATRAVFNRRPMDGAILLWDLPKVRR